MVVWGRRVEGREGRKEAVGGGQEEGQRGGEGMECFNNFEGL